MEGLLSSGYTVVTCYSDQLIISFVVFTGFDDSM